MESPLGDLVDYLVISAACFPRRSALVHQNHCVSYADLLAESQSLADVFKASGLKGKLVGIMAPRKQWLWLATDVVVIHASD